MPVNPTLYCPIRGQLQIRAKTDDGLTFTEEKRRIDCIRHLLAHQYPPENLQTETTLLRFGNQGRNSFRTDIVAFDCPAEQVQPMPNEALRERILLICEVKRDNRRAPEAKATQVIPALNHLPRLSSVGVYWDSLEQSVFFRVSEQNNLVVREAPITYLPTYGNPINVRELRYNDLEARSTLIDWFSAIENAIHPHCSDLDRRYEALLQLILLKIFDEERNRHNNSTMTLQDFTLFTLSDTDILKRLNEALLRAKEGYQPYLPKEIPGAFSINGEALRQASKHMAPVNLLHSKPDVMQDFYMYFASRLYKKELGQYFTPYEVVDFIVTLANPSFGDTIKDPACGSADFLVSAHRKGVINDPRMGDKIWGADNTASTVQISALNMLLNGDGKSQIKLEDSLENVDNYSNRFSVMLCNPPFGVKITEKRQRILKHFDLGKLNKSQQTGILFAELCVKQAKPGGRIAIILPNGYLGNSGENYLELRKWFLCHARLVAVIGFPRFTFKKSGADVSASVVLLEKRYTALDEPSMSDDYPIHFNLLDSVGYAINNSKAERIYLYDKATGARLLDENNQPILNADFERVLTNLYASPVATAFPWLTAGQSRNTNVDNGWSVSSREILADEALSFDPKRWCQKYAEVVREIEQLPHFRLLDVCDLIPESNPGAEPAETYRYVQLQDVNDGIYSSTSMKGWELPSRAKHRAKKGDIYIASIWSSVRKWFIAGTEDDEDKLIVSNGFYRLRPRTASILPDVVSGLCSEIYRVQMRALATGSDGLAQITPIALKNVVLPYLTNEDARKAIAHALRDMLKRKETLSSLAHTALQERLKIPDRKTQFSQV